MAGGKDQLGRERECSGRLEPAASRRTAAYMSEHGVLISLFVNSGRVSISYALLQQNVYINVCFFFAQK